MSWRFRKTFKVLPGVKLNLTRHGLSATLGASPFSVNVGPRGVYGNVGIPGTGLWNRERLDVPSSQPSGHQPQPIPQSTIQPPRVPVQSGPSIPSLSPVTEIRSASTELLNSQTMDDLRRLLKEASEERGVLIQEISKTEQEGTIAARRYEDWGRGLLFKRVFTKSFAARKEALDTANAKLEELREQLRFTTLATEIAIEREQAEPYYRMRDDFAALSECQKIWDTLERHAVNRVAERSAAYEAIKRDQVSFSLDFCDLIQWEQKVPHLPNRTGGDMYIYPGFILYRASKQAFALIDSREVTLTFRAQRFIEEEAVPSDTLVVGQAWAKSNKDGSPDLRFRDNHQIPVVFYGSLAFSSPSGLHEEFQVSNPAPAERFTKSWNVFQQSFVPVDRRATAAPEKRKTGPSVGPTGQTPGPTPRKAAEHIDVATAFAKESDKARALALEQGEFWQYSLVEELLRARLAAIKQEYDESDRSFVPSPKTSFSGKDYVVWLGDRYQVLGQQLVESTEQLMAALRKHVEPDAIRILSAVNEITDCCRAFFKWELEIGSAEPPVKLRRLGNSWLGITEWVIGEFNRLLDEIGRAVEVYRTGARVRIELALSNPPQIKRFMAEMEKVNRNPEWLVS